MAKLSVRCPKQPERILPLTTDRVAIGRSRKCDIVVPDKALSRQHCNLERDRSNYRVVDLGSANGTRLNGARISTPQPLMTGDLIRIGRTRLLYIADTIEDQEYDCIDAGQTVCLDAVEEDPPAPSPKPSAKGRPPRYVLQYTKGGQKRILSLARESVTIGRHKSCGLVFNDKSVSSCHARVDYRDGQYVIHDLGSTNGIKINGRRQDEATLRPGTRIRIGKLTLGFKEVVQRVTDTASPPPVPSPAEEMEDTPVDLPAVDPSPAVSPDGEIPPEDVPASPDRAESADATSDPSAGDLGHAMEQVGEAFADFNGDEGFADDGGLASAQKPPLLESPTTPQATSESKISHEADTGSPAPATREPSEQTGTPPLAWVLRVIGILLVLAALALLLLWPEPRPPAPASQTPGTTAPPEPATTNMPPATAPQPTSPGTATDQQPQEGPF